MNPNVTAFVEMNNATKDEDMDLEKGLLDLRNSKEL